MTRFTQSNGERRIEKILHFTLPAHDVGEQIAEWNGLMMGVKMNSFAVAATYSALLAGIVIPSKHGVSPFKVSPRFAKDFCWLRHPSLPMVSLIAFVVMVSLQQSLQVLSRSLVMIGDKSWYAAIGWTMHPGSNLYGFTTAALAKMLALVFFYPPIYATVVGLCVIAGIVCKAVSLHEAPVFVTLKHLPHHMRFNGDSQEKSGELREALPDDAEGNPQPSMGNGEVLVPMKVHRLASEEPTNNLAQAPDAKAMR